MSCFIFANSVQAIMKIDFIKTNQNDWFPLILDTKTNFLDLQKNIKRKIIINEFLLSNSNAALKEVWLVDKLK